MQCQQKQLYHECGSDCSNYCVYCHSFTGLTAQRQEKPNRHLLGPQEYQVLLLQNTYF